MEKPVELDDVIRAAFSYDSERICTPEAIKQFWNETLKLIKSESKN